MYKIIWKIVHILIIYIKKILQEYREGKGKDILFEHPKTKTRDSLQLYKLKGEKQEIRNKNKKTRNKTTLPQLCTLSIYTVPIPTNYATKTSIFF